MTRSVFAATMTICSNLVPFVDGELPDADAAEFRAHLRVCLACQADLVDQNQISAHLSTLGERSDLEWLLEDVSSRLARLGTCSCHDEMRRRLESCTSMLVRMTRPR